MEEIQSSIHRVRYQMQTHLTGMSTGWGLAFELPREPAGVKEIYQKSNFRITKATLC